MLRVWTVADGAEQTRSQPPEWAQRPVPRSVSDLLDQPRIGEACRKRGQLGATATPDGSWLAVLHENQRLSVWDVATGTETISFSAEAEVTVTAFSPAGELFAAGDERGGISVWRTSGTVLARFQHNEPILRLSFSPDAAYLAAASADGGVRMWVVAAEILAGNVRPRLNRGLSREEWERYLGDEPYVGADVSPNASEDMSRGPAEPAARRA